eukprot:g2039.t1
MLLGRRLLRSRHSLRASRKRWFCAKDEAKKSVMTEYGRVHWRLDNEKWQAHDVSGAYVGQYEDVEEAKTALARLVSEESGEENTEEIIDSQKETSVESMEAEQKRQQVIRGSDSMLEIEETPAPWTQPGREKKSRGEKVLEDANWILRKSKGAYWAVGGVAALGTLTAVAGVWGRAS